MFANSKKKNFVNTDHKTVSKLSIHSVHTHSKKVTKDVNDFEYYQALYKKLLEATRFDLEQAKLREVQTPKSTVDANDILKSLKDGKDAGAQYHYMKYEFAKIVNQKNLKYVFTNLKSTFKRPSEGKFLAKINEDPTNPLHYMNAGLCRRLKNLYWDNIRHGGLSAMLVAYLITEEEKFKSEILDFLQVIEETNQHTSSDVFFLEYAFALVTGKPIDELNKKYEVIINGANAWMDFSDAFKNNLETVLLPQKEHSLLRLEIWQSFLALKNVSEKDNTNKIEDQKLTKKKSGSNRLFYNSKVTNDNFSSSSYITPMHSDKEDSDVDSRSSHQDESHLSLNDMIAMRDEIHEMQKRLSLMEKKLSVEIEQCQSVVKMPSHSTLNKKG